MIKLPPAVFLCCPCILDDTRELKYSVGVEVLAAEFRPMPERGSLLDAQLAFSCRQRMNRPSVKVNENLRCITVAISCQVARKLDLPGTTLKWKFGIVIHCPSLNTGSITYHVPNIFHPIHPGLFYQRPDFNWQSLVAATVCPYINTRWALFSRSHLPPNNQHQQPGSFSLDPFQVAFRPRNNSPTCQPTSYPSYPSSTSQRQQAQPFTGSQGTLL